MCGIFAYFNYNVPRERRFILEVLFNGLCRLEYLGYDSSGIAIDADVPAGALVAAPYGSAPPLVFREEGKIQNLVQTVYSEVDEMDLNLEALFTVHAGIAHTRWATYGLPVQRNSHPQSSGAGNEFLVVHNGLITNYEVLKGTLVRNGFTFESDTDTEIIPKLAKFVFDKACGAQGGITFSEVVMEVTRQLEGAYALIFKSPHYPNELIACTRGSTLILGIKELNGENSGSSSNDIKNLMANGKPKELFLSNDLHAIVEHTENYMAIEDNEVIHIKI